MLVLTTPKTKIVILFKFIQKLKEFKVYPALSFFLTTVLTLLFLKAQLETVSIYKYCDGM